MKTLCIDFDGVICDQSSPAWEPTTLLPDVPPVDGAADHMQEYAQAFVLVILTARTDIPAVWTWLSAHGMAEFFERVTNIKPPAWAYLDDRGWHFGGPGTWPSVDELLAFEPWHASKRPDTLAHHVAVVAAAKEPQVTEDVTDIVSRLGGTMDGLDFRLKTLDSIQGKITSLKKEKGLDPQAAAEDIKDALRYTAIFPDDSYVKDIDSTLDSLIARGYGVERVRNYWTVQVGATRYDPGTYVGVNCVLTTPTGYTFELQFHTPEGSAGNDSNDGFYRQIRLGGLNADTRKFVDDAMRARLASVPVPPGIEDWTYHSPAAKAVRRAALMLR